MLRSVPFSDVEPTFEEDPASLLATDEALSRLEARDPRQAEVVLLRYFAGLTTDEAADVLGVSPSSVDRRWRFVRAWLRREMGGATADGGVRS